VAGACEHGYEPSVSMKCGYFLEQLSDYQLIKRTYTQDDDTNSRNPAGTELNTE
jgi:hypothetical protein